MKKKLLSVAALATIGLIVKNKKVFGKLPTGSRKDRIVKSSYYDGKQFNNIKETPIFSEDSTPFETFMEFVFRNTPKVYPEQSIPYIKTDFSKVVEQDYYVWFGHSSYLLHLGEKNFLIDPVFSGNASPVPMSTRAFKGSDYYKSQHMPEIDYLIITHDHYDHLDYKTVVELKDKVKKVIVPLGVGEHFEYWGYDSKNIIELEWEEDVQLEEGIKISSETSRHSAGRFLKFNQALWSSYVLTINGRNFFLGADGCYGEHFKEIGEKYGDFEVVFLENGQYNLHWKYSHMFPEDTLKAAQDLNAKTLIPIHNSKFKLSTHPWNKPMQELVRLNDKYYSLNLLTPKIGEVVDLNNTEKKYENWFDKIK